MTYGEAVHKFPVDIPTSVSEGEADLLVELAQDVDVLEVGSLLGFSTVVLARAARQVWSVDPHVGYPTADPKPTLTGFMANLDRYGVRGKVVTVIARAQDVLPQFKPGSFSLVFIDNTVHCKELIYAANNLDPRWIAVHDYGHPVWTGATEAVEHFRQVWRYPTRIVDRLLVMDVGAGRDARSDG